MKRKLNNKIILIPGLGNNIGYLKLLTSFWKYFDYEVNVISIDWLDKNLKLDDEIEKIKRFSDNLLSEDGDEKVSLIGISAGGSLALNTYLSYPKNYYKVINVCGRLKVGNENQFQLRTKNSNLFKESVISCENRLNYIENYYKEKILSISAKFGDELVPKECSKVDTIQNIEIFGIEHLFSIFLSLTIYVRRIFKFLNK